MARYKTKNLSEEQSKKVKEERFNKLYATYSKRYKEMKSKSDVGMAEKLNKTDFIYVYMSHESEKKERYRANNKPVPRNLNIIQDIVYSQQDYEYSLAQSRSIKRALVDMELKQIRKNLLKQQRQEAKAARLAGEDFVKMTEKELRARVESYRPRISRKIKLREVRNKENIPETLWDQIRAYRAKYYDPVSKQPMGGRQTVGQRFFGSP